MAVISPDAPGDRPEPGGRVAFPVLAVAPTFGAALAFAGVGAVTWSHHSGSADRGKRAA
ncbi:MAG: hypothetical protein H0T93_05865 [Chloroflexia bacterium]|nr:hypothetical protein [Chloroflexia bacterium]